jgi:hypothetical protein
MANDPLLLARVRQIMQDSPNQKVILDYIQTPVEIVFVLYDDNFIELTEDERTEFSSWLQFRLEGLRASGTPVRLIFEEKVPRTI